MEISKELLNKMYVEDNMTIKAMTKILKISHITLRKKLVQNGFVIKKKSQELPPIILTKIQEDILIGGLLGDACLVNHKYNSSIAYLTSIKEHCVYFCNFFKEFMPKNGDAYVSERNVFDKRTNKTYVNYTFGSVSNITFTKYREKWYPNNTKKIPVDLILNNSICLMWYLGDGSLQQDYKYNRTCLLKLSTNGFLADDIENILIPQLVQFEAYVRYNGGKPVIIIPRRKIPDFLSYIGDCPVSAYEYKWKVYDYKIKHKPNIRHAFIPKELV